MRIAMVAACPFPWPRGTPVRIHRLAEALGQMGHDVHVTTYHLGERGHEAPFTVHRIRDIPSYRYCEPGPTLRKLVYLDPSSVSSFASCCVSTHSTSSMRITTKVCWRLWERCAAAATCR